MVFFSHPKAKVKDNRRTGTLPESSYPIQNSLIYHTSHPKKRHQITGSSPVSTTFNKNVSKRLRNYDLHCRRGKANLKEWISSWKCYRRAGVAQSVCQCGSAVNNWDSIPRRGKDCSRQRPYRNSGFPSLSYYTNWGGRVVGAQRWTPTASVQVQHNRVAVYRAFSTMLLMTIFRSTHTVFKFASYISSIPQWPLCCHTAIHCKASRFYQHYSFILCVLDRASSWYLNKGRPTWWHLLYYVNLLLNMFQMLIHPSSGACNT